MIAALINLPAVAVPLPGAAQIDSTDPFAALFAALVPADGAVPEDAPLLPVEEDEAETPSPSPPPSPEDLLALITPAPLPKPDLVVADSADAPPRLLKSGRAELVTGKSVEAVQPDVAAPIQLQPVASAQVQRQTAAPLPALSPLGRSLDATRDNGVANEAIRKPVDGARSVGRPVEAIVTPAMLAVTPPQREAARTPVRDHGAQPLGSEQPPVSPLPALQFVPQPAVAAPPGQPMAAMAQQLAGQIATALPRLRQAGGEAVLTLDPARLGRVTLSWQTGDQGTPVLTVRAVEPATAVLLNRLSDDIATVLRGEPSLGGPLPADLRIDIARADRAAEPRPADTANFATQRDPASDAGQARQHHRAPDPRAQVLARPAVNPGDPADAEAPRPRLGEGRARLA